MKKKDFVTLVMSVIGGILLGLGMCMSILPEMGSFSSGVVIGTIGIIDLLAMIMVRRKMDGKPVISFNIKAIGITLFGCIGAIVLGVGLCMVMIWNMLVQGIIVGIVGIILLLCLIPATIGLK